MVGEELLRVVDVWKSYGTVVALRGVNMVVRRGEVVALLGDNGAGKSTLIKIISGYLRPDRGQLIFEGKPVRFKSPLDAKALGIEVVHQDLAVILDLPVYRNIFLTHEVTNKLGFLKDDIMKEEAKKALDAIGITMPPVDTKAEALSGGQRQATAVARATYFAKKLLLMDEPTAGLGVVESKKVINIAKKYAKELNLGVIFVTPNIFQAYEAADRIYYMEQGKIVFEKYKEETSPKELTDIITNRIIELRGRKR
ncbi:ATP-binding cassette domain-containing protein [Vulcanisaeta souniana]|nr:ATP-binding cassette domain-containing protein [Vulcanisaeta souniana]